MSRPFETWMEEALQDREAHHLLRTRRLVTPVDATHVTLDGRRLINFASNNYLGLTHHPRMLEALHQATSTGSGAAGLVTGHTEAHAAAERDIAEWKQTEAALLMPSGYQANLAVVQTLQAVAEARQKRVRFIVDKLAHASLIDAARQTQHPMRVFPHNHLDKLARLLDEADPDELQVVLTESIFSMDGDAADLAGLAGLKSRKDFVLVVDEAHGSGVYGPGGSGLVAEVGLRDAVDISVVTLSKALGVAGGAICGSKAFIDAVLNFGRAYIYSTSVPPVTAALASRAIAILRDEPWRQSRVRALATALRDQLAARGLAIPAGDSPIIPIILQDEAAALAASKKLEDAGLLVVAVRPPTVARGTSRLRVTLSAAHEDAEIEQLIKALESL